MLVIYAKECNKKCKYCLWGDDNSHSNLELDKDFIEQELSLAEDKSVSFIYTGGEPFFDKETLSYVKYLINTFCNKFKSVTILSNMDHYEPLDVNFFPLCIVSHNNYKKIYPFEMDGVFVWNTIWIDDIRPDKILAQKNCAFLFRMKFKTLYNSSFIPNDNVDRNLIEDLVSKLPIVNFIWPDSLASMDVANKNWEQESFIYKRHIFQPSGINRVAYRSHVCRTCKYESCNEAIELDDCAAMNKDCYKCKYSSICPMTSFNTESVDISYYKKCSTLKWLLSLKEKHVRR